MSSIGHAGGDDVIGRCAAFDDKDARIACLEAALRRPGDAAEIVPPAADVAASDAGTGPAPQRSRAQPVEAATPAPAPAGAAAAEPAESVKTLGAEQVGDRPDERDDRVEATAIAFDFVRYQRLRVRLDNGQIWRQVDGDRANVTRDLEAGSPFDVELWKTGLGGYRMRIIPLNRTLRVQRLK